MFLGFLVLITALSISAVAIYYSVAGLVAIFAAATVPIIIMGSVLEVSKLITTIWLHRYWNQATWWLKSYLSFAVIVLMFITSMGIFGFLSKAHIEQTAQADQSVQEIQQIDEQILREQSVIERANLTIQSLQTQGSTRDQEIQEQINLEQDRINTAYDRIDPALKEQQAIIDQRQLLRQQRSSGIESEIASIQFSLTELQTAIANSDIAKAQTIVGTKPDGDFGPGTQRAVSAFRQQNEESIIPLQQRLDAIRTEIDTVEQAAREEINRLRLFAEQQITDSNSLISRLRSQIGTQDTTATQEKTSAQQAIITQSNETIDSLVQRKFALETEYRLLEAEVGPVKYLAEFIYGQDAGKDLLEAAVKWVIVIIIFVFDPLAVLLLIASQHTFEIHRKKPIEENNNEPDRSINDGSDQEARSSFIESTARESTVAKFIIDDTFMPDTTRANDDRGIDSSGVVLEEIVPESKDVVDPVAIAKDFQSKKKS